MKNEIEEIKDLIKQAIEKLQQIELKTMTGADLMQNPEFKAGDFVRIDIPDGSFMYMILKSELVEGSNPQAAATKNIVGEIGINSTFGFHPQDGRTARHMTESEKAEFLEMIKKAGYQYNPETNTCTKLRWRAEEDEIYFYIGSYFDIRKDPENGDGLDNDRYNAGNYFQTEAECQAFCDKVKALANGND